jgi:hypothetical protein
LLYGGIIQTYSTYVIIMTTSSHSAVTFADDNERQEEDVTLPSFKQRFDKLKPSRELLQFYRSKFIEYDAEYQELCKKIESYESVQLELVKHTYFYWTF